MQEKNSNSEPDGACPRKKLKLLEHEIWCPTSLVTCELRGNPYIGEVVFVGRLNAAENSRRVVPQRGESSSAVTRQLCQTTHADSSNSQIKKGLPMQGNRNFQQNSQSELKSTKSNSQVRIRRPRPPHLEEGFISPRSMALSNMVVRFTSQPNREVASNMVTSSVTSNLDHANSASVQPQQKDGPSMPPNVLKQPTWKLQPIDFVSPTRPISAIHPMITEAEPQVAPVVTLTHSIPSEHALTHMQSLPPRSTVASSLPPSNLNIPLPPAIPLSGPSAPASALSQQTNIHSPSLKLNVEQMHKTNLLEKNPLEEPSGSSNCRTPGRKSSLSRRDVDRQVFEKPPAIKVGPSKVSRSSEKIDKAEMCPVVIDLVSPDASPATVDQIPEISTTGNDNVSSTKMNEAGKEQKLDAVALSKKKVLSSVQPSTSHDKLIDRNKANGVAPKIDRTNLKPLTVRSGNNVRLEIEVKGEPVPTITWTIEGKPLPESTRVKPQIEPNKTIFVIRKALKKDTNNYVITAQNSNGTDEATLELKVLVTSSTKGNCGSVSSSMPDVVLGKNLKVPDIYMNSGMKICCRVRVMDTQEKLLVAQQSNAILKKKIEECNQQITELKAINSKTSKDLSPTQANCRIVGSSEPAVLLSKNLRSPEKSEVPTLKIFCKFRIQDMEKNFFVVQQNNNMLQKKNEELIQRIAELEAANIKLSKDVARIQDIEEKVSATQQNNEKIKNENEKYRQRLADLDKANALLRNNLEIKSVQSEATTLQLQEMENKLGKKTEENESLEKKKDREIAKLLSELYSLNCEVTELRIEKGKMDSKHQHKTKYVLRSSKTSPSCMKSGRQAELEATKDKKNSASTESSPVDESAPDIIESSSRVPTSIEEQLAVKANKRSNVRGYKRTCFLQRNSSESEDESDTIEAFKEYPNMQVEVRQKKKKK